MNNIVIDSPLYMVAHNERIEENKNYLFHYTNPESFFKIIDTMTLKMSEFSKSDDLNEANLANVDRISDVRVQSYLEHFIKEKCSYLSFIHDGDDRTIPFEGENHPRMWAQYAQRGSGVCFAIDKESFLEINTEQLNDKFFKLEPVEYSYENGADVQLDMPFLKDDSENIIEQYYKELFFKKHIDWKEENETRLFGINLPEFLSLHGAIKFICLGPKFIKDDGLMNRLLDFLIDDNHKFYNYLTPYSFADINPYSYGYYSDDAYIEIYDRLKKWEKYKRYIDEQFEEAE